MKEKDLNFDSDLEEANNEELFDESEEIEDNPEELAELRRTRCEIKLVRLGTNLNEQRQYFEIMKRNDMPIGNGLLAIKLAESSSQERKTDLINSVIKEWEEINIKYQAIKTEDQDKNTGKEIIVEMKKLIVELLEQLKVWQENPNELPRDLSNIIENIKKCGEDFLNIPAYIAYRDVGMYELNSDRLKSKNK